MLNRNNLENAEIKKRKERPQYSFWKGKQSQRKMVLV
jgi:hypothetical protein